MDLQVAALVSTSGNAHIPDLGWEIHLIPSVFPSLPLFALSLLDAEGLSFFLAWISSVRCSDPVLTSRAGSKLAMVRWAGSLKAFRISDRRRPKNGVSTVRTIALYPASIRPRFLSAFPIII